MNRESKETDGAVVVVKKGGRPLVRIAQREAFLTALEQTHHVGRAVQAAGICRATAYRLRDSDPDFAAAWEAAMAVLPDRVMDAAIEEGLEGRPVRDLAGNVVGSERNTPVLRDMFRKFHDPQRGSTHVAVGVQVGDGVIDPRALPALEADLRQRLLPPPAESIADPAALEAEARALAGEDEVRELAGYDEAEIAGDDDALDLAG